MPPALWPWTFPSKQLMLVSNALFPGAHRSFPVTWAGKCVLLTCTAADRILPCLVQLTVFKLSVLPLTAERARVEMQLSHTHRGQSPWAEWFTTPPICLTRCALPHSSSSCRPSPCPVFPFKLLQRPLVLISAFLPGPQLGFSLWPQCAQQSWVKRAGPSSLDPLIFLSRGNWVVHAIPFPQLSLRFLQVPWLQSLSLPHNSTLTLCAWWNHYFSRHQIGCFTLFLMRWS